MTVIGTIKGKAVLRIERLDSQYVPFDVHVFPQAWTPHTDGALDSLIEDFGLMDTDTIEVPQVAHKLKVGQWAHVAVTFEFVYTRDYWGEYDCDFYLLKQRVLSRSRVPRTRRV